MLYFIDDELAAHTYHKIMAKAAGFSEEELAFFPGVDQAMDSIRKLIDSGKKQAWPSHIFIDINMPYKSGYDFVEEFSQTKHDWETPLLYFVSSSQNPHDIAKISQLAIVEGFESKFLEQPFFASIIEQKQNESLTVE